jgi:hypothetical protein
MINPSFTGGRDHIDAREPVVQTATGDVRYRFVLDRFDLD